MQVELQSKIIDGVTYERGSKRLRVFLKNGQRREYRGVPLGVVNGMILASSPGSFYMSEIRSRYAQL